MLILTQKSFLNRERTVLVVEFSSGGYKVKKIYAKAQKFDFQSQFSMSKIIRIFLIFFFR